MDRVLDLLHKIKWESDGSLTFRRSCAHGVCGSDAMMINGRNRLACKIRVDQLGRKISVAPLPGMKVIKDLVVDMDAFFAKYRSVMPYLMADDEPPPNGERLQSAQERERYDDTTKCILCAACTSSCPSFWAQDVRRPGRDSQCAPLHLRLARRPRRRAAGDPRRPGRRVALPHDLQLHRRVPARDQHHPRHPRSVERHRGAAARTGPLSLSRVLIRADGAARGNPGPASAGAVIIDASLPELRTRLPRPSPEYRVPLGIQTNNYAEYTGVILALEKALTLGAREVELVLDSMLIVEQLAAAGRSSIPRSVRWRRARWSCFANSISGRSAMSRAKTMSRRMRWPISLWMTQPLRRRWKGAQFERIHRAMERCRSTFTRCPARGAGNDDLPRRAGNEGEAR